MELYPAENTYCFALLQSVEHNPVITAADEKNVSLKARVYAFSFRVFAAPVLVGACVIDLSIWTLRVIYNRELCHHLMDLVNTVLCIAYAVLLPIYLVREPLQHQAIIRLICDGELESRATLRNDRQNSLDALMNAPLSIRRASLKKVIAHLNPFYPIQPSLTCNLTYHLIRSRWFSLLLKLIEKPQHFGMGATELGTIHEGNYNSLFNYLKQTVLPNENHYSPEDIKDLKSILSRIVNNDDMQLEFKVDPIQLAGYIRAPDSLYTHLHFLLVNRIRRLNLANQAIYQTVLLHNVSLPEEHFNAKLLEHIVTVYQNHYLEITSLAISVIVDRRNYATLNVVLKKMPSISHLEFCGKEKNRYIEFLKAKDIWTKKKDWAEEQLEQSSNQLNQYHALNVLFYASINSIESAKKTLQKANNKLEQLNEQSRNFENIWCAEYTTTLLYVLICNLSEMSNVNLCSREGTLLKYTIEQLLEKGASLECTTSELRNLENIFLFFQRDPYKDLLTNFWLASEEDPDPTHIWSAEESRVGTFFVIKAVNHPEYFATWQRRIINLLSYGAVISLQDLTNVYIRISDCCQMLLDKIKSHSSFFSETTNAEAVLKKLEEFVGDVNSKIATPDSGVILDKESVDSDKESVDSDKESVDSDKESVDSDKESVDSDKESVDSDEEREEEHFNRFEDSPYRFEDYLLIIFDRWPKSILTLKECYPYLSVQEIAIARTTLCQHYCQAWLSRLPVFSRVIKEKNRVLVKQFKKLGANTHPLFETTDVTTLIAEYATGVPLAKSVSKQ